MDFFGSQDQARRNTRVLIVLFSVAVICIIAVVNLLILVVANYSNTASLTTGQFHYSVETFLAISGIVLLLILGGSAFRVLSLAGGGEKVAEMLDGRLLDHGTANANERRLLNVVEEMAIASGTPVPPVYLIPEQGINAFAAGYSPSDAVIGVTEGAARSLNRDQLQGVIAHEFSHILNGDMRMNIRLMGVVFGILMLAMIGRILLRSGGHRSSSRRDSGGGAILAIGLGLVVVGYVGLFFGNLIKAAVSRQREFLADASAVQFTRNPEGIGGALRRIGGFTEGSLLANSKSEELSHTLFAQGLKLGFTSLFATHPPLEERISRIMPSWDGSYHHETLADAAPAAGGAPAAGQVLAAIGAQGFAVDRDEAVRSTGNPDARHLAHAQRVLGAIPETLAQAAREPYSARAVVYLMLLDEREEIRAAQFERLRESADPFVFAHMMGLVEEGAEVEPRTRLPLLEMALPRLRQLSDEQHAAFIANVDALIEADQKIGLSEWALRKFIDKHLTAARAGKTPEPRYKDFRKLGKECACLLSTLAYADLRHGDSEMEFAAGVKEMEMPLTLLARGEISLPALEDAVDRLSQVRPLAKPRLLKACVAVIAADGMISVVEEELVRTVADLLDCPLPPLSAQNT